MAVLVFRPLVVVLVVAGFKWTMVTGGPPVSMRSPSGYVRSSPVGADTVYLNPRRKKEYNLANTNKSPYQL